MSEPARHAPPTQQELAALAGVSQSAVSRTFGGGRVAETTRQRVLRAAHELGYNPDAIARSLVTGQTSIVAVVMGDLDNPFYPLVLDQMTTAMNTAGKQVLLFTVPRGHGVDDVLPQALSYRVSGVVVASAELSSRAAELCAERGIPLVLFNRYVPGSHAFGVSTANHSGGRKVAEHLISRGLSRLAYVGGSSHTSTNTDRLAGFAQVLDEHGLQPALVIGEEFTYDWGQRAAEQVAAHHGIDGVFCANDIIAMGLMDGLRSLPSAPMPAVVGFDGIPAGAWPSYSLTTVRQPIEKMIEATLHVLTRPASEGAISDHTSHEIEGELIVRSSA